MMPLLQLSLSMWKNNTSQKKKKRNALYFVYMSDCMIVDLNWLLLGLCAECEKRGSRTLIERGRI